MKGSQKSQNQQAQQSQVQTPKGSMLTRINNRIRSQNSNKSGILSQTDANFSEINSSMRFAGMGGAVVGQETVGGGGNLGLGMGNINYGMNALDISQISRISPQSSMITITNSVKPHSTERQQLKVNENQKHQQQSSQTSIGSIQNLFNGSKKENLQQFQSHQHLQQQQLQHEQQIHEPQNVLQQEYQIGQEQKQSDSANNNTTNKRMTFQPVIIPTNYTITPSEKTNTNNKQPNKKQNTQIKDQSPKDSSQQKNNQKDINFTNFVQGIQNVQNGRPSSGQSVQSLKSNSIIEKTQKSNVGNMRKNILPPSSQKQQTQNKQQQQKMKQVVTLPSRQSMNATQHISSRNEQIIDQKNQTTGNRDLFSSEKQQLIEQIRTESQLSMISQANNIQSQSVLIKSSPSTDKRQSLISQDFCDQQSNKSNIMKNTPQKKQFKVVVVQSSNNNDKVTQQINNINNNPTPEKDSIKTIQNSNTNTNQNKNPMKKYTPATIKHTSNNSISSSQVSISQTQRSNQQQPKFQSQKSIISNNQATSNSNTNKKPIFLPRQARKSSQDSLEDEKQDKVVVEEFIDTFDRTQKLTLSDQRQVKSVKVEEQKQKLVEKDQNSKKQIQLQPNQKQSSILLTTHTNQSNQNTQETELSQNTQQSDQNQSIIEKKPIQKISKVVILPPTLNKNEKSQTDKFNQTQKVTSQRKILDNQKDKRKSLGNELINNKQQQQQQCTNITNTSPLKKQKTGVFGPRAQRNLSQDSLEDKFDNKFEVDNKTKTQEIININKKGNNNILIEESKSFINQQKYSEMNRMDDNQSNNSSSINKLNKIPSQSSIVSFLNLEKEAQSSAITQLQQSKSNQQKSSQITAIQNQKQLVIVKGDSRLSLDKNISIVKLDSKKQISSQEKIDLNTTKQSFNQSLNHFKSASQVVTLTNKAKQMIIPRDQKNTSSQQASTIATSENQSSNLTQKQQQQSQQKNMKILQEQIPSTIAINKNIIDNINSNENNSRNTVNNLNKPSITVSSFNEPIVEKQNSQNQQEKAVEQKQTEKAKDQQPQIQQKPLPNLAQIAQKQQQLNSDTDTREYNKIKNEINQYLKSNNLLQYTDQDFSPDYKIEYEGFRNLLKHLYLLNPNKMNPIQDYLIGQMWVKELQGSDSTNLKNVINLITGILKIPVQEIIIQSHELNSYSQNMSVMLFNKAGLAKFKSKEDIETCANTYIMLSRQREELIVERKNQESQEKRKAKELQNTVQDNMIRIEVGSLDNKNQLSKLAFSHISPRSIGSDNSLQFSDIEKHSQRSRAVVIPIKQSEEEIKLELVHNNLSKSNQKGSPILDFIKADSNSLTNRDGPSNEQKGFKSHTPSARNNLQSQNLLNVVNNKALLKEKSKFGKIVEEITPVRRESGETPRVRINKLDNSRNNEVLSKSIAQHTSSDNIRSTLNFPANLKKLNNGKVAFTQGLNSVKGRKKIILDLTSPDQYLTQLEQLPINPKFDSKQKMPVEEDSDKSKFGKLSDGSKLSEMIRSVGGRVSDDSDKTKRPLLFMDVNLGQQKGIQKLIVYEHDQPKYLAKKFGELHELREKAVQQLAELITRKIDEALEARKHIKPRSKSPEIRSREPSPTDMTLRVVKRTQGVKVKSNTHGEVKIKREEDDEEEW